MNWFRILPAAVAVALLGAAPANAQRENTGQGQRGRVVDTPPAATTTTPQRPRSTTTAPPAPANNPRAGASETVYVKRDNVALRSAPERTASDVKTLSAGEELVVLGTEGIQLQVRTSDGKVGYIAKLNVTDVQPRTQRERGRVLVSDDLGPGERSNISSIRGLSPDAERMATEGRVSEEALRDVQKMEQISESISESELERFKSEGGVNPL